MIFIDWEVIWEDFQEWWLENNDPEWEVQQAKIQVLVDDCINNTDVDK